MEISPQNQKEAIRKVKGPCIILAGAGTGKTHTIAEKLKYLIQTKTYNSEKIVCLTFSNEAANEMKRRILKILKDSDSEPIIKTFHSFCADILRKHGQKINIPEDFTILLPDDAKIILHKNFKLTPNSCNRYISQIGAAKDLGITPQQIEQLLIPQLKNKTISELEKELENTQFTLQTLPINKEQIDKEKVENLKSKIDSLDSIIKLHKFLMSWKGYEKLKDLKKFQDYSDLNKNALILLEKHPEIAEEYEYIIVDEFQDTNKLQCDFLEKLAYRKNITVVGDLNQSIYRFRGAYKHNIENFKKVFQIKESDIYMLDKSFRSTNKILRTAHKLIQHNYVNKEDCFPVFSAEDLEGNNVKVFELKNNKEETRKIVELIKSEIQNNTPSEEICVMFRTHQQARALKSSLDYEKIPYTSATKRSLLKLTPIKLTIDYLTILNKLKNKLNGGEQAWWDLIHHSSFNKEDAIIISRLIKENKKLPLLSIKLLNFLSTLPLSENGRIQTNILIKRIKTLLPHIDLQITELILKVYEIAGIRENKSELLKKEKTLVLKRFHELAEEYKFFDEPYLSSFLHHLEIISSLGIEVEAPSLENQGIRIMTNHATKGLEYKTVIISSLAQKKFPLTHISKSILPAELSPELSNIIETLPQDQKQNTIEQYQIENQILEERRLCYVAFTRAKRNLILTYASKYNTRKSLPSQFLNEINYKQNQDIEFIVDGNEKFIQPKLEIKPASEIYRVLRDPENTITDQQIKIIPEKIKFSTSALEIFDQCQKRYEYKYVYNMPDPKPFAWDAMKLGSFVHVISEKGVKQGFSSEKEFLDLANIFHGKEEWNSIQLSDALHLIKIFYHRNKNKYNKESLTEQRLFATIDGLKFIGYADRIDIHKDGIEIIDYKTGNSTIKPRYRNWQLGFYALAAQSMNIGRPKRLTLDMLRKDSPIEFDLDDNGNVNEINSQRTIFSLEEVKEQIVSTAREILHAHKNSFKACEPEKNCAFCNEYVWEI